MVNRGRLELGNLHSALDRMKLVFSIEIDKAGLDLHPFILRPRFLQFLEIWFEKSGSRNLVREQWLTRKKGGFIPQIQLFSGWRKVVDQKKKSEFAEPLFQNHFSTLFQNSGCRINGPLVHDLLQYQKTAEHPVVERCSAVVALIKRCL